MYVTRVYLGGEGLNSIESSQILPQSLMPFFLLIPWTQGDWTPWGIDRLSHSPTEEWMHFLQSEDIAAMWKAVGRTDHCSSLGKNRRDHTICAHKREIKLVIWVPGGKMSKLVNFVFSTTSVKVWTTLRSLKYKQKYVSIVTLYILANSARYYSVTCCCRQQISAMCISEEQVRRAGPAPSCTEMDCGLYAECLLVLPVLWLAVLLPIYILNTPYAADTIH